MGEQGETTDLRRLSQARGEEPMREQMFSGFAPLREDELCVADWPPSRYDDPGALTVKRG